MSSAAREHASSRPAVWRPLARWFAASLALRLALWMLVVGAEVRPLFDEGAYYRRGLAFASLVRALFGAAVDPGAASAFYDGGTWPPLQPTLLGLAFLGLGPGLAIARLAVVLVSAATTPLVYALTARLSSRRAAAAAAAAHTLFPTFLAFSHYLWAETVSIALVLALVYVAARVPDARTPAGRIVLGAALGLTAGLAALTRAAAAPWVLLVPAWLAWRTRGRRGGARAALAAGVVAVVVLLPWHLAMDRHEGRWSWFSTAGGYNLYLGNNPWVVPGHGSSWGEVDGTARLLGTLNERVRTTGAHRDVAARELALEEMTAHPGRTIGRVLDRARLLASADAFLARHLLEVVYPPGPAWLAGALLAVALASQLALVTLAAYGLALRAPPLRARGLLLALLVLGALPPLATISVSRMALPLLALLLPAAGHGAAALRVRPVPRTAAAVAFAVGGLAAFAAFSTLPVVLRTHATPSGHYASLARVLERGIGEPLGCADKVVLRAGSELVGREVALSVSRGYRFLAIDGSEEAARHPTGFRRNVLDWTPRREGELLVLEAFGRATEQALRLVIRVGDADPVEVPVVERAAWLRYVPTEVPGLELSWQGAGARAPVPTGRAENDG